MKAELVRCRERAIQGSELKALYQDAGWWHERNAQDLEEMLQREISMWAWHEGRLIGFARAVTDGRFRAYIEDVVVHSEFKKTGIGSRLVEKLLEELAHIDVISLFCEEELISFYEKNRFKHSRSQFVMHRK